MPTEVVDQIQNLSFFTLDTLIIALVLVAVFVYAYTIGKDFVATMIIALYFSAALIAFTPILRDLEIDIGLEPYLVKMILLLVVFVITMFVITRNGYFEPYIVPSRWEVPVFCVLFAAMLLAIASTYLPPEMMNDFAPSTRWLFGSDMMISIWLMAPVGAMLVIRGRD